MEIEFVAHSSIVFRRGPVNMICDPWLAGTAFDDGWALLSEPAFKPEDFASITHIWFSHEHPDHFSPRTLAMIPEEFRKHISVLFHESKDKKIVNHCNKLGFAAVEELPHGEWRDLGANFEIQCNVWEDTDDSWMLIRTPEEKILNLNDCQAITNEQANNLLEAAGEVDVLMTQFSISAWDGNPEDLDRRLAGANAMVERVVLQTNTLNAKFVIPFASFVWFCHDENHYMNEGVVNPATVVENISSRTTASPVVLYPADTWTVGSNWNNEESINRYSRDLDSLATRPKISSSAVDFDDLRQSAERFTNALNKHITKIRLRLRLARMAARHTALRTPEESVFMRRLREIFYVATFRTRATRIWLTDHEEAVAYSARQGLTRASFARDACDIELSSAALNYAFRFLWGGETLQINGRFREVYPEGRRTLFDFLWIASDLNHRDGAAARPL